MIPCQSNRSIASSSACRCSTAERSNVHRCSRIICTLARMRSATKAEAASVTPGCEAKFTDDSVPLAELATAGDAAAFGSLPEAEAVSAPASDCIPRTGAWSWPDALVGFRVDPPASCSVSGTSCAAGCSGCCCSVMMVSLGKNQMVSGLTPSCGPPTAQSAARRPDRHASPAGRDRPRTTLARSAATASWSTRHTLPRCHRTPAMSSARRG
ncbi:Uncharacterised protein [Burkholderia pseudomallei]|nr:Uncharacterised protein [Burkholderia pseudomallei]